MTRLRFNVALPAALFAILMVSSVFADDVVTDDYQRLFEQSQTDRSVYGASNCGNCHAGKKLNPQKPPSIEYDLWRGKDDNGPHFRAYTVLSNDRSMRMARILSDFDGSSPDPVVRGDCLSCHAFAHDAPEERRIGTFAINDGVTCEACHGRGAGWQSLHQEKNWHQRSAKEWLDAGMYEVRDVRRWAEKCLQCHLGTPQKQVTHAMMGAGHPELTFEFAYDLFNVPKHWDDQRTYLTPDEGSWYYARVWTIGQVITFRESMRRLARHAEDPSAVPDFALFDCSSCHHELQSQSWRQGKTFLGAPGQPLWNAAPWAVCRMVVNVLDSSNSEQYETHIKSVYESLSISRFQRDKLRESASALARLSDDLVSKIAMQRFDRDLTRSLLKKIAADPEYVIAAGPRAAEQAYGAFYALYRLAWAESGQKPENDQSIRLAIQRLYALLYDSQHRAQPERFDPDPFREIMKELSALLEN